MPYGTLFRGGKLGNKAENEISAVHSAGSDFNVCLEPGNIWYDFAYFYRKELPP